MIKGPWHYVITSLLSLVWSFVVVVVVVVVIVGF